MKITKRQLKRIIREGVLDDMWGKITSLFQAECSDEALTKLEKLLDEYAVRYTEGEASGQEQVWFRRIKSWKEDYEHCADKNPDWPAKLAAIERAGELILRKRQDWGESVVGHLEKEPGYYGPWSEFHEDNLRELKDDDTWDELVAGYVKRKILSKPLTKEEAISVIEAAKQVKEGRKIRVSKRQLRRIIKEEKATLLKENMGPFEGQEIIDGYYNAINQMIHEDWAGAGVDPQESPKEVSYVAQALRNLLKDLERGQI